jgi:hypothetical protein
MKEQDPIENKFRSAFSDFEQEPPARAWEHLHAELHPEPPMVGFWSRMMGLSPFPNMHPGFYLLFGGISFTVIFSVVFILWGNNHVLRGHAYAGESRLRFGNAELFRVSDHTLPWDSVTHYRSAAIDEYGHFQFFKVEEGRYLVRIAPEAGSAASKKFQATFYDSCERSDSATLIEVITGDLNLNVRLIPVSATPESVP